MHYTYILHSKKLNRFYIGTTQDLKVRISQHNKSKGKATSPGSPWILVYYEAFVEKSDAYREEKFLKSGKGRERRKFLLETWLEKNKK